MRKVLLVDGLNIFIRNFCVVPTTDRDGNSIGGLTGFLKSIKSVMNDFHPDLVVVVWDGEGGSRRRRGIFSEYKAGRKVRLNRFDDLETQDESFKNFPVQVARLRKILDYLGVVQIQTPDIEADDAIAFLCQNMFSEDAKLIFTSDRDMIQLVNEKTIVFSPTKKVFWSTKEVTEKVGVLPENYIFVKAMMGDGSDNIPGIGGIGEKTAVKLFPFLAERPTSPREIREFAEANASSGSKYQSMLDSWERFAENMKLMQLQSPVISPTSARNITISSEARPTFSFTQLRLHLVREGITSVDPELFAVFEAYKRREEAKRLGHT